MTTAIISESDQWHPASECENHDILPASEFHYVMPPGAEVIELTQQTDVYYDPETGADTDEVAARRWVSEWEGEK